jgi:hypothetical protein
LAAPEHAAPTPASGRSVLVIAGVIASADARALCERLRISPGRSNADPVICDVGALVDPDLGTIDALARLALSARRLGHEIRLRQASWELIELVAMVGLADVVPCGVASGIEPRRETEQREELRGVEEERDPADPPG